MEWEEEEKDIVMKKASKWTEGLAESKHAVKELSEKEIDDMKKEIELGEEKIKNEDKEIE